MLLPRRASRDRLLRWRWNASQNRFPDLKTRDLYITGESYAGIYVPKLAQQILARGDPAVAPQFEGFAVGDACVGTEVLCGPRGGHGPWYEVLFFYGHGQFSTVLYDKIVDTCTMDYLKPAAGVARRASRGWR